MHKYLALFLLLAGLPVFAQTVVFTWTSNGNPTVPACSATVTTSCIVGETLTDTTTGTVLATSSVLTPSTLTYTYTIPALTAAASHTYSLVTNAKDSGGNADPSAAVPAVPPNPPAGFGGATVAQLDLPDGTDDPAVVALFNGNTGANFHAYVVSK